VTLLDASSDSMPDPTLPLLVAVTGLYLRRRRATR
jgi:uncharacterized protein (TIGR03382 family)